MQEVNEMCENGRIRPSMFEILHISLTGHDECLEADLHSIWAKFDLTDLKFIIKAHTLISQMDGLPNNFSLSYAWEPNGMLRDECDRPSQIKLASFIFTISRNSVCFSGTEKHTGVRWKSEAILISQILKCLHPEN